MRFRMLIGGLVLLIIVYTVFWFVSVHDARVEVEAYIRAQKEAGHDITYGSLDIGGFPYRIEVSVEDLQVKDTDGSGSWLLTSPKAAVVAMPWNLKHRILFAETISIRLDDVDLPGRIFTAENFRGSIVVDDDTTPLRVALTSNVFRDEIDGVPASVVIMKNAQAHWRAASEADVKTPTDDEENAIQEPLVWQASFKADELSYPDFASSPYGADIQHFNLMIDMRGSGLGPGATTSEIANWRDNGGTLEVTNFTLQWGALDTTMSGSVTLDQQFRPLGAFTASVKGYEPLIDHFIKLGVVAPEEADTAKATLDAIIAADNDNDGRLNVPLTMQSGRLFLGPLPLAELQPMIAP